MNFQSALEIYAGGKGSGCNPKVAQPRCGRPNKPGGKQKTPIKFRVSYKRGKKTFYLTQVKNMDYWLHPPVSTEEKKKYVGQDKPPTQVHVPPVFKFSTDPEDALLVSKVTAQEVDKLLWKKWGKLGIIESVKLGQKKVVEEEKSKSRSKLSKQAQQALKDKGALVKMTDKGIKYQGTPTTPRRVIDQKTIKVKVEGSKKTYSAIVTVVKPTGTGERIGSGRKSFSGPHSLSGKFVLQSDPVKIKAENRTSWIYNAESGKGPGWGTTLMVHQIKHTPTRSSILIHQLEREMWAEQISQTEFKFKKGKAAVSFLFERYGIRHKWRY